MTNILIGYARCSTDHGLSGTNRARPGLEQVLAAVRTGDTFVVAKLAHLARSVPDARAIADSLSGKGVKLAIGHSVYDPHDPMGKMFFNILATFAEFESDLIRLRTREGMAIARAKGKLRGRRAHDFRLGGIVQRVAGDDLPNATTRANLILCNRAEKSA